MRKKNFFTIGSLILGMFFSLCMGACASNSEGIKPTITMPEKELLLNKEEMSILLGESDYILVETVGMEVNVPITFTSSDENVATVDGIGVIQAKSVGTATITITADGVVETCIVKVTLGQYLPELSLKQIDGASATIGTGGALNFQPVVIFNHQEYTDATYSYKVEDESIGTVQNGVFTATGKVGSTAVTVYATWRGQSGEKIATLQKTVTVTVAVPVVELYTRASFAGKEYATSASLLEMIDEENATDIQTNVITGEDVVRISDGKITANTYGKAKVSVTYKNGVGQTLEKQFIITVQRPVAEYSEVVNFSIMDGDIPVTEIWGNEVEVTEAYFGTPIFKGETVTVTEGKITEGISLKGNESERKTITLLTETEGYTVDVCVYTKLIDEAEDLVIFSLTDKDITGVYLVTKDIDASAAEAICHSGYVNATNGYPNQFTGVFDGGGHTITVNVANGGLFGKLQNATITNANFLLNIGEKTTKGDNFPTGLAWRATDSTISNVYAELNPASGLKAASGRTWALSLIVNADKTLKTEGVVVVNNDDFMNLKANTEKHWVGGALFYADSGRSASATRDQNMQNVFVIAPESVGNGYHLPMAGGTAQQTFASNDGTGKEDAAAKTGKTQFIYANVTRYESVKKLCASSNFAALATHIAKTLAEQAIEVEIEGDIVSGGAELLKGKWTPISLKVGNTLLSDVRLQSSDDTVASVQENEIKMENFGTAIVTATGTAFGIEITTAFSVTARVDAYDQEWLFSSADGIVDIQSIFGKGAVLVNAYGVDGTNYTVKDGKITDLTNDTNTALIKEVILETEDGQFKKVTFKVYTKLIDDAADLTIFNLTNNDITGAYIVTKDIVMSGTATMAHTAFVNASTGYTYKFKGSFDGGGHTVTANVARGGLFGALENATITNTNFVLNISGSTHGAGNNPTGLAYGVTGDQGTTTISNVYAELNPVSGLTAASNRTWALSLIVNASKALKMENAVIVNNDDFSTLKANTDKGWVGGALFYVDGARSDSAFCAANRKNVFVIAPKQLGNGYYVALSGGTTSQVFASNDAEGKADAAAKTNAAQYTYANVTRYATAKEFVDSKAWENILPDFIMNAVNAKITAVS